MSSNKNFTQALFDAYTSKSMVTAMSRPAEEVIEAIHAVVTNASIPASLYQQQRAGETIRDGYFSLEGPFHIQLIDRLKKKSIVVDTISANGRQLNVYFKVA
jgi:hypothetical protein